VGGGKR
jgi:hypothetical protein